MADFEAGELAALGVGEEGGEAVPAGVGEAQLRARVGTFPADDQPRAGRSCRQVQAAGDLGCLRALAGLAVDVIGRRPGAGGNGEDRLLHLLVDAEPEGERAASLAHGRGEDVGGARSVGADQDRRRARLAGPLPGTFR